MLMNTKADRLLGVCMGDLMCESENFMGDSCREWDSIGWKISAILSFAFIAIEIDSKISLQVFAGPGRQWLL
jgi:hypothetical protein